MRSTEIIDRLLGFGCYRSNNWGQTMSQVQSSNPLKDLAQVALEVVKLLPDGSKITASDFAQTFGVDTVQLLQWFQMTAMSRSGNRVTAERANPSSQNIYGVQLILAKRVSFDVAQGPT